MAVCLRAQGKEDEAKKYFALARRYAVEYAHPKTARNLNYIASAVLAHGAKLVFMQYPMRSVTGLKKMLADFDDSIFFIDNEAVFKKEAMAMGAVALFSDLFGGDFGHLTLAGKTVLVDNMVRQLAEGPLAFMRAKASDKDSGRGV